MNIRHYIQLRFGHALLLVCMLVGVTVVAGCSSDAELPPLIGKPEARNYQAGLRLTVSDQAGDEAATRTPAGDYDRGAGYENYIDIENKDFRFLFFDGDNRFIDTLTVVSVLPVETTATSKTYEVLGNIGTSIKDRDLKVVVLANWRRQYPTDLRVGETTIADICGQTYDFSPAPLSAAHTIPLYGVKDFTEALTWDVNNYTDLGRIHLLRAYAKVEVLTVEDALWPIDDVKLVRYNKRGYCAPEGIYTQDAYVHGNYEADYVQTPHIPTGTGVEDAGELTFTRTADNRYVVYIPEYRNVGRDEAERSRIMVHFEGSNLGYLPLEFKFYDGEHKDEPFNILRNNWYRYTVNKVTEEDVFPSVVVQVVPYAEVELEPEFGLDSPEQRYIPIYMDDRVTIRCYYDAETGRYYIKDPETGDFIETVNPFYDSDAGTGWRIFRDDDGNILYYYDLKTGQYYDADRKPIDGPPTV